MILGNPESKASNEVTDHAPVVVNQFRNIQGRGILGPLAMQELAKELAPQIAALILEFIQAPKVTPRWLDFEQAAVLMGTTKDSVRGMARAKLFPVHKMGNRVMIDTRELEKAFAENTVWLN